MNADPPKDTGLFGGVIKTGKTDYDADSAVNSLL